MVNGDLNKVNIGAVERETGFCREEEAESRGDFIGIFQWGGIGFQGVGVRVTEGWGLLRVRCFRRRDCLLTFSASTNTVCENRPAPCSWIPALAGMTNGGMRRRD